MFSRLRQSFLLCCLVVTVLTSSGCFALLIGAAAGAAGAVYVQGSLEKNFDRNIKDVHKAAIKTFKSQNIFLKSEELNYSKAEVKGEFPDGEAVFVGISALTEKSSKVVVRVGIFGDEVKSAPIMNAIERRL